MLTNCFGDNKMKMTKLSIALMSISITLSPLAASSASNVSGLGYLNFNPLFQKNVKKNPRPLNNCERFPECSGAPSSLPSEPDLTASDKTKKNTKMYKKRKDSI